MRHEKLERRVAALESRLPTPEDAEKRRRDEFLSKCTDDELDQLIKITEKMRCPLMISPSWRSWRPDMKLGDIDRRLAALEVDAKPRVISTLLDLINCIGENEDVELSPELQELMKR